LEENLKELLSEFTAGDPLRAGTLWTNLSLRALARRLAEMGKHNPLEHRLYPHVTRACQGVVFHTVEIAKQFMSTTSTAAGLRVTVNILDKVYATGRKCAADFKQTRRMVFDEHLPKWNYRAIAAPG
jgi:hypothetical protein